MTHIETERLILRQFTEKDAGALFSLLSDKEVNTFLPMSVSYTHLTLPTKLEV